jgi:hypothetical protein
MSRSHHQKKYKGGLEDDTMASAKPSAMNVPTPSSPSPPSGSRVNTDDFYGMFSGLWNSKNFFIILLFILLVLSFLGINILMILGNTFQWIIGIIGPFFATIFSYISYALGSILNKTADVVSDSAKTGIDIAEGTVQSVGNLLRNSSNADVDVSTRIQLDNVSYNILPSPTLLASSTPPPNESWSYSSIFSNTVNLDNVLNTDTQSSEDEPSPNDSWCLVGEYNGVRSCVKTGKEDKCMSGQIYPSEAKCLNTKPITSSPPVEKMVNESSSQEEIITTTIGQQQLNPMGSSLPMPPTIPQRPLLPNPNPVSFNSVGQPSLPNMIQPNPNMMNQNNDFGQPPLPIPPGVPPGMMGIPLAPPQVGPPPPMNSNVQGVLPLPPVPGRIPTMDGAPIVAGPPNYFQ